MIPAYRLRVSTRINLDTGAVRESMEVHLSGPSHPLRTVEEYESMEPCFPAERIEFRDPTDEELAAMGLRRLEFSP